MNSTNHSKIAMLALERMNILQLKNEEFLTLDGKINEHILSVLHIELSNMLYLSLAVKNFLFLFFFYGLPSFFLAQNDKWFGKTNFLPHHTSI